MEISDWITAIDEQKSIGEKLRTLSNWINQSTQLPSKSCNEVRQSSVYVDGDGLVAPQSESNNDLTTTAIQPTDELEDEDTDNGERDHRLKPKTIIEKVNVPASNSITLIYVEANDDMKYESKSLDSDSNKLSFDDNGSCTWSWSVCFFHKNTSNCSLKNLKCNLSGEVSYVRKLFDRLTVKTWILRGGEIIWDPGINIIMKHVSQLEEDVRKGSLMECMISIRNSGSRSASATSNTQQCVLMNLLVIVIKNVIWRLCWGLNGIKDNRNSRWCQGLPLCTRYGFACRFTSGFSNITFIVCEEVLAQAIIYLWILLTYSVTSGCVMGIGDKVLLNQLNASLGIFVKIDMQGACAQLKIWQSASIAVVFFLMAHIIIVTILVTLCIFRLFVKPLFEVISHEGTNIVDFQNRCCLYCGWQLYGLLCSHIVAALLSCRQNDGFKDLELMVFVGGTKAVVELGKILDSSNNIITSFPYHSG